MAWSIASKRKIPWEIVHSAWACFTMGFMQPAAISAFSTESALRECAIGRLRVGSENRALAIWTVGLGNEHWFDQENFTTSHWWSESWLENRADYYHRNQQYSITAVTTSTGAVAERYAYTAYGVPTIANASGTVVTSSAISNRYMYTGREWDSVIQQYHYRARMYDASLGRFCSRDPIGYEGSPWNLYEFLRARSLTGLDPSGLDLIIGDPTLPLPPSPGPLSGPFRGPFPGPFPPLPVGPPPGRPSPIPCGSAPKPLPGSGVAINLGNGNFSIKLLVLTNEAKCSDPDQIGKFGLDLEAGVEANIVNTIKVKSNAKVRYEHELKCLGLDACPKSCPCPLKNPCDGTRFCGLYMTITFTRFLGTNYIVGQPHFSTDSVVSGTCGCCGGP